MLQTTICKFHLYFLLGCALGAAAINPFSCPHWHGFPLPLLAYPCLIVSLSHGSPPSCVCIYPKSSALWAQHCPQKPELHSCNSRPHPWHISQEKNGPSV